MAGSRVSKQGIAIIAFGASSAEVPWNDGSVERWSLHDSFAVLAERHHVRRLTLATIFELHSVAEIRRISTGGYARIEEYVERMAKMPIPIMVLDWAWLKVWPTAKMLPVKDLIARGRDYFTCTVPYMIALAIDRIERGENDPRIELYGVDAEIASEWSYERPCIEWWAGLAEGRGIKVAVAKGSSLMRHARRYPGQDRAPGHTIRVKDRLKEIDRKVAELEQLEKAKHDERIFLAGAASESRFWAAAFDREALL